MRKDNFDDNGNLLCRKCNTYKSEEHFFEDRHQQYRNFKGVECKECQQIRKQKYWKTKEVVNLDKFLKILLNGCKSRISRGKMSYRNLKFDLDAEFLKNLWTAQNGECAISGIPMTYIHGSGKHTTNASIDRIDPLKGYTKDNVQLVCSQVNMMKSNMEMDELYMFCENILKHKKNEYTH